MITPGDGDDRHGTANGYGNLGCRCTDCRVAHAAECLKQKQQPRAPLAPGDPRHGTSSGYRWWHCKCRECLDRLCIDSARSRARVRAARKAANTGSVG